jgi:co-chaperonin GroES (HSP10)
VVSIGDKCVSVKVGDTVVYSKFGIGVTDLEIKGEEFAVLKEEDIIGVFPTGGAAATASDVASLRPLFDRVLVKVVAAHIANSFAPAELTRFRRWRKLRRPRREVCCCRRAPRRSLLLVRCSLWALVRRKRI